MLKHMLECQKVVKSSSAESPMPAYHFWSNYNDQFPPVGQPQKWWWKVRESPSKNPGNIQVCPDHFWPAWGCGGSSDLQRAVSKAKKLPQIAPSKSCRSSKIEISEVSAKCLLVCKFVGYVMVCLGCRAWFGMRFLVKSIYQFHSFYGYWKWMVCDRLFLGVLNAHVGKL